MEIIMTNNLPTDFWNSWDINMPWLPNRTIFITLAGSRAYGTSTPTSDFDYRGIAIPPREYLLGFLKKFEQAEKKGDPDVVIYDFRKFISLAAMNNPNILELLYTDPSSWIYCSKTMEKLIASRDLFLSKKIKFTFLGYAYSQLAKINLHRRHLLNPPDHHPTREEFGLVGASLIPIDQLNAAEALIKHRLEEWELDLGDLSPDQVINVQSRIERMLTEIAAWSKTNAENIQWDAAATLVGLDANLISHLTKERRYHTKMREWKQYQDWKTNRNPARAELEEKFGYDVKHASHSYRLILMCQEMLEGKGVIVKRPDAEEILNIKRGGWSYDKLMEWASGKEKELDILYKTSTLQKEPQREKIDKLCVELIEEWV